MIGKEISPILSEIEDSLWEFEDTEQGLPGFTEKGFRAAIKIFTAAIMEQVWQKQKKDNVDMAVRCKQVQTLGSQIRELILNGTGIDTHKLYE